MARAAAVSRTSARSTLRTWLDRLPVLEALAGDGAPVVVACSGGADSLALLALAATAGTAAMLEENGVPVATVVAKVGESIGVDAVDLIGSGKVDLVINTPRGRGPRADGAHIRRASVHHGVACITTVAAGLAAAQGIAALLERAPEARPLQEYHRDGQLRLGL